MSAVQGCAGSDACPSLETICICNAQELPEDAPVVLLLPGLTGALPVRCLAMQLLLLQTALKALGMNVMDPRVTNTGSL